MYERDWRNPVIGYVAFWAIAGFGKAAVGLEIIADGIQYGNVGSTELESYFVVSDTARAGQYESVSNGTLTDLTADFGKANANDFYVLEGSSELSIWPPGWPCPWPRLPWWPCGPYDTHGLEGFAIGHGAVNIGPTPLTNDVALFADVVERGDVLAPLAWETKGKFVGLSYGSDATAVTVAVVPEPSSLLLAISALGLLGLLRWRK